MFFTRSCLALLVATTVAGCEQAASLAIDQVVQHPHAVRDLANLPLALHESRLLNDQGLRPDVVDWIGARGGTPDQQAALMQAADALQRGMLLVPDESYVWLANELLRTAQACLGSQVPDAATVWRALDDLTFNTPARRQLRQRYMALLGQQPPGQTAQDLSDEPPPCSLDRQREAAALARAVSPIASPGVADTSAASN